MQIRTLKTAIYALFLTSTLLSSAVAADIVCSGPDLSSIVYDYKGATKLILKRGNSLPVSAVCRSIETGELACIEDLTGESIYFRLNEETRDARVDIGAIKLYGLKCPLPQKKPAPAN